MIGNRDPFHTLRWRLFQFNNYISPRSDHDLALATIPAIPPLSGWLTLIEILHNDFIEQMITICGGLHFHHVFLASVPCGGLVLEACAGTLETLQLCERTLDGECSLPGEDFFE